MADPATRARRLDHLRRLGEGEEVADFAAHHEIMRPDLRDYRFGADEPVIGIDPYAEALTEFRRAISDFAVDIPIDPIVDGDHVTTVWAYRGRMTGGLWGLPASGRTFAWRGCSIWTFDDDDRITELRTFGDIGQLLGQITAP